MMMPCGASTIIECSVRSALKICTRVILVGGYRGAQLADAFDSWQKVVPVLNDAFDTGMFSSIKRGVELVRTQWFFLALGDMPLINPDVYHGLLDLALQPDLHTAEVFIPTFRERRGHPILLSQSLATRIAGFDDSKTMRDVLADTETVHVPVADRHILTDVDNRQDYANMPKKNSGPTDATIYQLR